jgi:hypothetical protein
VGTGLAGMGRTGQDGSGGDGSVGDGSVGDGSGEDKSVSGISELLGASHYSPSDVQLKAYFDKSKCKSD